ncbi:hypothetical protein IV203_005883 [Nitzschia inconspicua]|uniref:Phosphatidylinositol-specific phospholipase C X domain-containing protein n=1 Tax=Nitzschia inconspicua TaxID=303405 RepID=A0A9K3PJ49_9STRA|nr:hypothetical protein IV203_005883 [Nitzschia inconspicua]
MCSDLEKWIEIYGPIIHQLPLNKLCLVETHDSGTFRMKSPIVAPWATTQHATIEEQLQGGVRVLDLRLGCDGPQTYLLVHGMWRTVTSLNDALCSVCGFVDRNTKEVVILDFHRFVELEGSFDWIQLQETILRTIGKRIYRYCRSLPTLEQIWKTAGRIIVAWNSKLGLHPHFFPGIEQGWYPSVITIARLAKISKMHPIKLACGQWEPSLQQPPFGKSHRFHSYSRGFFQDKNGQKELISFKRTV